MATQKIPATTCGTRVRDHQWSRPSVNLSGAWHTTTTVCLRCGLERKVDEFVASDANWGGEDKREVYYAI